MSSPSTRTGHGPADPMAWQQDQLTLVIGRRGRRNVAATADRRSQRVLLPESRRKIRRLPGREEAK